MIYPISAPIFILSIAAAYCWHNGDLDAAASLLGAAATIGAGVIAWIAVQRQMKHAEEIAHREKTEAEELVAELLRDRLSLIEVVWADIDTALSEEDREKGRRYASRAASSFGYCPNENDWIELEARANLLGPKGRFRIRPIVEQWKRIAAQRDEERVSRLHPAEDIFQYITGFRIQYSHLERFVRDYDPALADVFASRTKEEVRHDAMAEIVRQAHAGMDARGW